jgi:DNA-binding transcriptional MocR family regulator
MVKRMALYVRLADEIQKMIESDIFKAGERLPSIRTMSRVKNVSIPTAIAAYQYLEDRELIRVRPQSGYFVMEHNGHLKTVKNIRIANLPNVVRHNDYVNILERTLDNENLVQYDTSPENNTFFPVHRLSGIMSELLRHDPSILGRNTLTLGDLGLRKQIARRLINWNCLIDPEEIVITNGGLEAINLCLKAITIPGDIVAVESPAYYGFLNLIDSYGLRVVEIPSQPSTGINLKELQSVLLQQPVKVCLLCTSVSNPLGATMPVRNKQFLLELLEKFNIPLIEDATFADLHYEASPPAAQSFDTHQNVLLCASLTKSLAPGFRIGWVYPGKFLKKVYDLKRTLSGDQSEILQRTLAAYYDSGGYERHLRKVRHELQARMHAAVDVIRRSFPAGTSLRPPSGGFMLWLQMRKLFDVDYVQSAALQMGLRVAPGRIFSISDHFERYLRLNFAQSDMREFVKNLQQFGNIISSKSER